LAAGTVIFRGCLGILIFKLKNTVMTREQLENLKEGEFIHSKWYSEWEFISFELMPEKVFIKYTTKEGYSTIDKLNVDYFLRNFDIGRVPKPETQITCTVADALKKGLKVGDKVMIELDITDIKHNGPLTRAFNKEMDLILFLSDSNKITFTPQPQPYQPAHDEICTVLTTEGLATKCKSYHHNGAIYAIALKNDKPDGTFAPEQIAKFLKL